MNKPTLSSTLTTNEYKLLQAKLKQDEKDRQYCYKPYRTIHNY